MKMARIAVLAATLTLVAYMPHDTNAPTRWALVVGISDYQNFGPEIGGDLPGAAWDARRMRDVLIARWGFDANRVRMVLDGEATRERIETEFTDWLPSVVKEGDVVLFFFAGHGSQTWDLVGDEEDGLDETICPTDVLKGDDSRDIRDDELNGWLTQLPTEVIVILDNCNAGTGTRAATPFARPRSLARTTADVPQPAAPAAAASARAGATASAGARNVLEIAAAQAGEVAVDAEWPGVDGGPATHGGAFTTALVKNLWRVSRRTSYEDIYHLTAADMQQQRFAQQPLLTKNGVETRAFAQLDGESSTSPDDDAFVPVTAVSGTTVTLAGGTGAGMTPESLYEADGATLRVTAVDGATARAVVVSGSAPRAGANARLTAFAYPESPLRVSLADVDAATRSAVQQATGATGSVMFSADARDFSHLILRPAETGYVLIGMDGATRRRIEVADRAEAARAIAAELKKEAGAHQLAALDNPAQLGTLDFGFRGGASHFEVGDEIGFRVHAPRDGYLTIVDLGTDGRISVLYPTEPGEDGRMAAGSVLHLPAADLAYEAQEPAGRGIVRAFLTDRPMDLRFNDDAPEQAANVVSALRAATGASSAAAIPTGSWLTTAVVYTIDN